MSNKRVILGVAAGVAILAVAGLIVAKKKKSGKFSAQAEEAKDNFKKKLNELQRKAKKEYKNSSSDTQDAINSAKDRANEWVNRANA
jgi:gas vesicle protein